MIHLTGTLSCATQEDAALVTRLLPEHIRLTRAGTGCLAFSVTPMPGGLCWAVEETFADRAAFAAHQTRTAASEWGLKTPHIARDYQITDGADPNGARAVSRVMPRSITPEAIRTPAR